MSRRFFAWSGLILVLMFALTLPAAAQSLTYHWLRIDVDIQVLDNGDLRIIETQEMQFTRGEFWAVWRNIETEFLGDITDVSVREGDRVYARGSRNEEAPYTFDTWRRSGEQVIEWYFPHTRDTRHTWVVEYTVVEGVRFYDDRDEIWWTAVFADRDFRVGNSVVTVRVPAPAEVTGFDSYLTRADAEQLDAQTVQFRAREQMSPGQEFQVRVQFTPGVVQGSPPDWQAAADQRTAEIAFLDAYNRTARPIVNLFVGALGLLLLIGGPLGMFLLWYTRGRDKPVNLVADWLPEPPSDLPPGVAGTLIDERADIQDVIATVVDLARRGALSIEEIEEDKLFGLSSSQDYIYHRGEDPGDLLPYERLLIQELFGGGRTRKLSELRNKFYKSASKIGEDLYKEVVKHDFFARNPNKVRNYYSCFGSALVFLAFISGFVTLGLLTQWIDTMALLMIPIGLGATGVATMVFGQFMPRKTEQGAEAAARWAAFKRYLENIDKYTDLEQAQEIFEKYLPYAIAFGVEKSWIDKFARVDTPAPHWYRPVYMPRGGSSGGGGRAPGLGSPAPGGGGLSGTSRAMGASLSSMSTGLGNMLSTAATTMTSSPSSSGGGGGGGGSSSGGGGGGAR